MVAERKRGLLPRFKDFHELAGDHAPMIQRVEDDLHYFVRLMEKRDGERDDRRLGGRRGEDGVEHRGISEMLWY